MRNPVLHAGLNTSPTPGRVLRRTSVLRRWYQLLWRVWEEVPLSPVAGQPSVDEVKFVVMDQRWGNSVLRTEYKDEYYSVAQKWPNTNTNIIRFPKNDPIRILFGFPKMTQYEYYLVSQKWPNTNTNIIRFPKNDPIRIRILFGYPEMT